MLTKPIPEFFRAPLGSHRNYITYIAFPNHLEYLSCKKQNEEQDRSSTPAKYGEFRLFLNAVESLNNITDYLYSEHRGRIAKKAPAFAKALRAKYPTLAKLSELANAYKHCERDDKYLKRASDLQKTSVNVHVNVNDPSLSSADYEFAGPLPEDDDTLSEAFRFWLDYHNDKGPKLDELINV
jgi:hypothetical protein